MRFYLQQFSNIDLYLQLITEHISQHFLHVKEESVHDSDSDIFFYDLLIPDWRCFSKAVNDVLTPEQFQELILSLEFAV